VDDAHQGLGIGSALIQHLVAIARAAGLDALHAEVLTENTPMLRVFEKSGLAMSTRREHPLTAAVDADRLRDRCDVGLGERAAKRRAAMAARAKGHDLRRIAHLGLAVVAVAGITSALRSVHRNLSQQKVRGLTPKSALFGTKPPVHLDVVRFRRP
jgi:GNAT superfamily N-acetyltransferase